ncbi:MAG: hypothetical protein K2W92_05405 [Alphaproteobacteria bacterium]|nr:hypothetical protein [Alphaproteobacteria bacterium]
MLFHSKIVGSEESWILFFEEDLYEPYFCLLWGLGNGQSVNGCGHHHH